jgi:hypothetical protein
VHPNAGGIDVGNESHFAAVPADRDVHSVQEFGCWTADLQRMGQWLKSCRIDTVAVQATGVYWIPLCDILTQYGIQVTLVNAQHPECAGAQERCAREPMVDEVAYPWAVADSFRLAESSKGGDDLAVADATSQASRAVQHMQKALTK